MSAIEMPVVSLGGTPGEGQLSDPHLADHPFWSESTDGPRQQRLPSPSPPQAPCRPRSESADSSASGDMPGVIKDASASPMPMKPLPQPFLAPLAMAQAAPLPTPMSMPAMMSKGMQTLSTMSAAATNMSAGTPAPSPSATPTSRSTVDGSASSVVNSSMPSLVPSPTSALPSNGKTKTFPASKVPPPPGPLPLPLVLGSAPPHFKSTRAQAPATQSSSGAPSTGGSSCALTSLAASRKSTVSTFSLGSIGSVSTQATVGALTNGSAPSLTHPPLFMGKNAGSAESQFVEVQPPPPPEKSTPPPPPPPSAFSSASSAAINGTSMNGGASPTNSASISALPTATARVFTQSSLPHSVSAPSLFPMGASARPVTSTPSAAMIAPPPQAQGTSMATAVDQKPPPAPMGAPLPSFRSRKSIPPAPPARHIPPPPTSSPNGIVKVEKGTSLNSQNAQKSAFASAHAQPMQMPTTAPIPTRPRAVSLPIKPEPRMFDGTKPPMLSSLGPKKEDMKGGAVSPMLSPRKRKRSGMSGLDTLLAAASLPSKGSSGSPRSSFTFGGSRRCDRRRFPKTEPGTPNAHPHHSHSSRESSPKAHAGSSVLSTLLQHKRARYSSGSGSRSNSNSSSPPPQFGEQYQAAGGGRPHSSSFSSRHPSRYSYSHHQANGHGHGHAAEKYPHHHQRPSSRTQRGDSISSHDSSEDDGDNIGGFRGDERRVLSRDERRRRSRMFGHGSGDFDAVTSGGRPRSQTFDAHMPGAYGSSHHHSSRMPRRRRAGSREYYDSGDDDAQYPNASGYGPRRGAGGYGQSGPSRSHRDRSASFAHSGAGGYGRRKLSTLERLAAGNSGDYKKRLRPRTSNNNRLSKQMEIEAKSELAEQQRRAAKNGVLASNAAPNGATKGAAALPSRMLPPTTMGVRSVGSSRARSNSDFGVRRSAAGGGNAGASTAAMNGSSASCCVTTSDFALPNPAMVSQSSASSSATSSGGGVLAANLGVGAGARRGSGGEVPPAAPSAVAPPQSGADTASSIGAGVPQQPGGGAGGGVPQPQQLYAYPRTFTTRPSGSATGQKYSCGVCGKKFSRKGNMQRHEITHSNRKPYVCRICNRGFNDPSNMKKHQKNKHPECEDYLY